MQPIIRPPTADVIATREWVKAYGTRVKERGRMHTELVAKFKAATNQ